MKNLKWLIPAFFVLLGSLLRHFSSAHSFLGLICICIAGVIGCYFVLFLLPRKYAKPAKIAFTSLLCLGLSVCAVTEGLIIRASFGNPNADCPYVVVLGAKVNGTTPSLSLKPRRNFAVRMRRTDSSMRLSGMRPSRTNSATSSFQ